jgi:hypothetical protein
VLPGYANFHHVLIIDQIQRTEPCRLSSSSDCIQTRVMVLPLGGAEEAILMRDRGLWHRRTPYQPV